MSKLLSDFFHVKTPLRLRPYSALTQHPRQLLAQLAPPHRGSLDDLAAVDLEWPDDDALVAGGAGERPYCGRSRSAWHGSLVPPERLLKKTQACDIAQVLDKLKIEKAALVTHDIGNMVGYAFAAQFPARVTRWVAIDAPLPGIGFWDEIIRSPTLWHFNFRGPDVERLVKGRERIYLDRFWNELSANPKAINEATRRHYAKLYGRPGAMHSAFNQFAAFTLDAVDNKAFAASGKLNMPVLALGGDHSFRTQMADIMRLVATDVTGGVITDSGHWVMMNFLDQL
jgi:pimeloyl-ACP methyl ester carboxylesterase